MVELERRMSLWREVQKFSDGEVPIGFLHEHNIYRGAQGIYVDKKKTKPLTTDSIGVTVSVRHTGDYYPEELSGDGLIYHYPKTKRTKSRDKNEILATKHTLGMGLPIFVILNGKTNKLREVKLGWVVSFDDINEVFLILFAKEKPPYVEKVEEEKFQLKEKKMGKSTKAKTRPYQAQFRFEVMKNYGCKCAVCDVSHPKMLEAAHLCEKEDSGSDYWQNGIVLCKNHHAAFDNGLFGIEPQSKQVIISPKEKRDDLELKENMLSTLYGKYPHQDALNWRWKKQGITQES